MRKTHRTVYQRLSSGDSTIGEGYSQDSHPAVWDTLCRFQESAKPRTKGFDEEALPPCVLVNKVAARGVKEVAVKTVCRSVAALLACAFVGVPLAVTSPANAGTPRSSPGYWLASADGGVFSFDAPFYGSGVTPPGACLFSPQAGSIQDSTLGCAAIASTPSGNGYWLLTLTVCHRVRPSSSSPPSRLHEPNGAFGFWTGIASSPTGNGFFVTSGNGGVMGCGDAVLFGGMTTQPLNAPVVGIAANMTARATG